MGYVGLPLAVEFAQVGFEVCGIDIDKQKTDTLNAGDSYIIDVPTERLKPLVETGKLRATNDFSVISKLDVLSICVPTPLGKSRDPDVSYIVKAVDAIAKYLQKNQLVILENPQEDLKDRY